MMDISKLISFQPGSGINPPHVTPFIMVPVSDHGIGVRWLEYSPHESPTEAEVKAYKPATKFQKLDRFTELPRIKDTGVLLLVYASVADRDGKTLAVGKLPGLPGCLWTTLP